MNNALLFFECVIKINHLYETYLNILDFSVKREPARISVRFRNVKEYKSVFVVSVVTSSVPNDRGKMSTTLTLHFEKYS